MSYNVFKHEENVLNIVENYLNKNKVFDIDKILPIISDRFAKAKININIDGIRKILVALIEKNLLVEGSSLTKTTVLLNGKRRKIYAYVADNPSHFNKVVRETSFNESVVLWHLKMLIRFNFIKSENLENREIYFPSEMTFESAKRIYIASKIKSQKILFYLKQNNIGLTKTQLSEAIQMHPNTITKYLEDLVEYGMISQDNIGNRILYFLNEE